MDNLSGYIWKIDLVEIRLFPQATAEFECVRREKVWVKREDCERQGVAPCRCTWTGWNSVPPPAIRVCGGGLRFCAEIFELAFFVHFHVSGR